MATKLTDAVTATATGVVNPATLTKFPEGGATFSVHLDTGTATVELRAWVDSDAKEVLATFILPVPAGDPKAGNLFDTLPVPAIYDDFDWNVTAISGGGTLTMSCVGLGV